MERVVTVEIPEQWLQDLNWDQAAVVQEIIQLGVHQFKVRRALKMYQDGVGSLGYLLPARHSYCLHVICSSYTQFKNQ